VTTVPPETVSIEERRAALVTEWKRAETAVFAPMCIDVSEWAARAAVVLEELAATVPHIRAQVYAEVRQLSVDRGAEYRTPPCTNQGCPEVVGEHVHVLPFADLIGGGETGG
jgi:hypothetical protein